MDSGADQVNEAAMLLVDLENNKLPNSDVALISTEVLFDEEFKKYESWYIDSENKQQQCFQVLNALLECTPKDKLGFRKPLADVFKISYRLMTIYNQRINALILEDRILCKHAKEVSALMIRTVTPAIDTLKAIDKSFTAVKKTKKQNKINQISKQLINPVHDLMSAFNGVQNKLNELTKPLSAESIEQIKAEQLLEAEARALKATLTLNRSQSEALFTQEPLVEEAIVVTIDDFRYDPFAALVEQWLEAPTQESAQAIVDFNAQFQLDYQPLLPFFNLGILKSEYLFEHTDPACQAGADALAIFTQLILDTNTLTLDNLLILDKAMSRLSRLGGRISGEVWQLITEQVSTENSGGFHILNTIMRQHLQNREQPLLNHPAQACFTVIAETMQEVISHHDDILSPLPPFLQPIFSSVGVMRVWSESVNKPEELLAFCELFKANCSAINCTEQTGAAWQQITIIIADQLHDYIKDQTTADQQWQPYITELQQQFALFMSEVPQATPLEID